MTEEDVDVSNDENRAILEETDAPTDESPVDEQAVSDATDEDEAAAVTMDERSGDEASEAEPQSDAEAVEPAETVIERQEQTTETPAAQESEQTPTMESVIEAVLFASDEPLTDGRLAAIVETTTKQVRDSVETLNDRYEANHNAFRIEQIAGGYQMLTLNLYNPWLKKMVRARSDTKLSPAALETLAIIAYKQPIIRADIEAIRGVAVGEVIRSLMYKGLVKIAGRAEVLGRPILYGTTKRFLEVFGLNSLKDLPKAEDLKNPDR